MVTDEIKPLPRLDFQITPKPLSVLLYPHPVLTTAALPVTEAQFGTPDLRDLVERMFEAMYANRGIGLAAPQVGYPLRLAVVDVSYGRDPAKRLVLVNPGFMGLSKLETAEEGCLSVPGFRGQVARFTSIEVSFQDLDGSDSKGQFDGLEARAIQHEIDHLAGVLFIDRMSSLRRGMILRRIEKLRRSGRWGR